MSKRHGQNKEEEKNVEIDDRKEMWRYQVVVATDFGFHEKQTRGQSGKQGGRERERKKNCDS